MDGVEQFSRSDSNREVSSEFELWSHACKGTGLSPLTIEPPDQWAWDSNRTGQVPSQPSYTLGLGWHKISANGKAP